MCLVYPKYIQNKTNYCCMCNKKHPPANGAVFNDKTKTKQLIIKLYIDLNIECNQEINPQGKNGNELFFLYVIVNNQGVICNRVINNSSFNIKYAFNHTFTNYVFGFTGTNQHPFFKKK